LTLGNANIFDLDVRVDLRSSRTRSISIIVGNGRRNVTLYNREGCSGIFGRSGKVTFDDSASNQPGRFGGSRCANNTILPTTPLSIFTGLSIRGSWTVWIRDHSASGRESRLMEWCLIARVRAKLTIS
jgi:hypothetical protein